MMRTPEPPHQAMGLKMSQGMSNVVGMNENSSIYDVAVVGGGPAGLSAAIAIAQSGANTVLVARKSPYADNRTTALLGGSIDFLKRSRSGRTARIRLPNCA